MQHVSGVLQIRCALSKSVAVHPIFLVAHEFDAKNALEDSVVVAVLVVVQPARAATVKEELPQHHANQLPVKLIVVPLMVEWVAAELAVHCHEPFSLALEEVQFLVQPRPDE